MKPSAATADPAGPAPAPPPGTGEAVRRTGPSGLSYWEYPLTDRAPALGPHGPGRWPAPPAGPAAPSGDGRRWLVLVDGVLGLEAELAEARALAARHAAVSGDELARVRADLAAATTALGRAQADLTALRGSTTGKAVARAAALRRALWRVLRRPGRATT